MFARSLAHVFTPLGWSDRAGALQAPPAGRTLSHQRDDVASGGRIGIEHRPPHLRVAVDRR